MYDTRFIYSQIIFERTFVQTSLSIDIDDDFRECENELPFPALDFSNFQITPEEDGSMTLNGSVQFTGNYESPTSVRNNRMYCVAFRKNNVIFSFWSTLKS